MKVSKIKRVRRGEGNRTPVTLKVKIPKAWENFLRMLENEIELFHLLAKSILYSNIHDADVCTTLEEAVLTSPSWKVHNLSPCNYEEADTRIFLHILDAVRKGVVR